MEQLTLPSPNLPTAFDCPTPAGRFTFALPPTNDIRGSYWGWFRRGSHNWGRPETVNSLCLMFSPPYNDAPHDLNHLRKVMDVSFIPAVTVPAGPIWFYQRRNGIVVARNLDAASNLRRYDAGTGMGLLEKKNGQWTKRVWAYDDLFKYCFNLEKIGSSCAECSLSNEGCLRYTIESRSIETKVPDPLPDNCAAETVLSGVDRKGLESMLRRACRGTSWEYTSPRSTVTDPFSPTFILADDMLFSDVDDVQQRRKDSATRAAQTRKAVRRCKEECCYEQDCRWCTKPYYGRPHACQNGTAYAALSIPGPYSAAQFRRAFQEFWERLPSIGKDKVSWIAFNAGIATYLFGYELVLSKMTEQMNAVEFVRPATGAVATVSFEDAVLLCTTPYRWGSTYKYPEKRYTARNDSQWQEPPQLMSDDELYTYVEICQCDYTLQGGRGWSNTYPVPNTVEWVPGVYITFDTDKAWCNGRVDSVFTFTSHYSPYPFPKTAKWIKPQQEEAETDCLAPS